MENIPAHKKEESNSKPKKPRFVRWAVMLGIVVVLNLFFFVARALVLPEPQYDTYCAAAESATSTPQDPQSCQTAGGMWTDLSSSSSLQDTTPSTTTPQGYCDMTAKCQTSYDTAYQQYQLYAFIMEVAFGIVAIVIGVLPLGSSIVSTGLSYGGVLAFIVAAAEYWDTAGNWLRLGIALIALVTLIYIGLQRFRD